MEHYYHLFANGDDARNFITSEQDFKAAFNRFGVCACAFPDVKVAAFSIEESHPHGLVYGEYTSCLKFKLLYEDLTRRYIIAQRGNLDDVVFDMEILEVNSEDYLLNVASYVIIQPTKDGKRVMHHDYYWGTGCLYFRPDGFPGVWCFDKQWNRIEETSFGQLTRRDQKQILHSSIQIPDDWKICNGLILPTNYIAREQYESIFKTHNKYRVFTSSSNNRSRQVTETMAIVKGVNIEDLEARRLSHNLSYNMFGKKDARWLTPDQRLELAEELRRKYRLSIRQIATLSRLPEIEIRKYIK